MNYSADNQCIDETAKTWRVPYGFLRTTTYKLAKSKELSVSLAAAILGDTNRIGEAYSGTPTPGEPNELTRE